MDLFQTRKVFNTTTNESLMRNNFQYNFLTTEISAVEITMMTCKKLPQRGPGLVRNETSCHNCLKIETVILP